MYAVVEIKNAQFKVAEGDTINTDLLEDKAGSKITLDKVLVFANDKDIRVGKPYLKDVKVEATVVDHIKGKKVTTLKYRSTKDSATKTGNRIKLTALSINKIKV
ncbi:MAG: large subunit ribosomal protein L21 [Candidatus Omnitrophota bacterium]|jgi:large subunit ribosomal protein L21